MPSAEPSSPEPAPLLSVEGLSLGAAGRPLLHLPHLVLAAGERVALSGPSGLGKTTLLRTLAGLIPALAGRIALAGRTPGQVGWPAWRRRVLLVAQQPVMLEDTVEANLRRPFSYRSARGLRYEPDRARALLERLGLERTVAARRAGELSVGQQQRVALVRALLLHPQVLLLDEPTSALDADAAAAAEALLKEVAADGAALLLVSHDPGHAGAWAHRLVDLAAYAVEGP